MSAPRAIVQMIVIGTRMIGKALKDSYKQANANSAAARAAAGNAKESETSADSATRKTGIDIGEAKKILNLEKIDLELAKKKYEQCFIANEPKDGGSLYIQAKVVRAFERIQIEHAQAILKAEAEAKAKSEVESSELDPSKEQTKPDSKQ
ncbi:hypothetical protein BB561_001727 [Smittium simulii]|uniref:Mitochondrial import inner membrane translocase subunit TIM16 n=1 Tax=Smittium simulii TaxID=133385 RepID=A0A2T9YTC9_9FUNG|nr:hypothetical protein BB561_001727 [Smittium simulii]